MTFYNGSMYFNNICFRRVRDVCFSPSPQLGSPHPVFSGPITVWPKQDGVTRIVIPSCNQMDILKNSSRLKRVDVTASLVVNCIKICIYLRLSCLLLCF